MAAVLAVGCLLPRAVAADEAVRIFTQEKLGFTLSFPESLNELHDARTLGRFPQIAPPGLPPEAREASETQGRQLLIMEYPLHETPADDYNANLEIDTVSVAGQVTDSQKFAEHFFQLLTARPDTSAQEKPAAIVIGGRTFYRSRFSLTQGGTHLVVQQYVYVSARKELAYILVFTDLDHRFQRRLRDFEPIIQSFRLTFAGP